MTFIDLAITEGIREKAKLIALGRAEEADKWDRTSYFEAEGYPRFIRNWIGAIAEVQLNQEYPWLELSQPSVMYGDVDVEGSDFSYKGGNIEVKCRTFRTIWRNYLKNVRETQKKGHLSKVFIATAINGHPKTATRFYIFGYLGIEETKKAGYPIWRPKFKCNKCGEIFEFSTIKDVKCIKCRAEKPKHINRISAPGYAIPIGDFRDLKELWQSDRLTDFMRPI
jgi:hypothetical protein